MSESAGQTKSDYASILRRIVFQAQRDADSGPTSPSTSTSLSSTFSRPSSTSSESSFCFSGSVSPASASFSCGRPGDMLVRRKPRSHCWSFYRSALPLSGCISTLTHMATEPYWLRLANYWITTAWHTGRRVCECFNHPPLTEAILWFAPFLTQTLPLSAAHLLPRAAPPTRKLPKLLDGWQCLGGNFMALFFIVRRIRGWGNITLCDRRQEHFLWGIL